MILLLPDHAPAVKIVFSPPVIDHENRSGHVLEGIDVLMTARLTRFLQKTFDNDSRNVALYEYLGNAKVLCGKMNTCRRLWNLHQRNCCGLHTTSPLRR